MFDSEGDFLEIMSDLNFKAHRKFGVSQVMEEEEYPSRVFSMNVGNWCLSSIDGTREKAGERGEMSLGQVKQCLLYQGKELEFYSLGEEWSLKDLKWRGSMTIVIF